MPPSLPPVARAHHTNGTRLCEKKYDKSFTHWANDPIGRNGGRLSYSYALPKAWGGGALRLCVVTIRRSHDHPRFTGVRIMRFGGRGAEGPSDWRRDASHDYRVFAGPVAATTYIGDPPSRLSGRGTIGKAYTKFSLRYIDSEELVRLRSRYCGADGYAHGRDTRWLNSTDLRPQVPTTEPVVGSPAASPRNAVRARRSTCPSV